MMTLEELQELGAISGSLKVITTSNAVSISQVQEMSELEQATFNGVVVVDDAVWIATAKAMPADVASIVYSCNGENIGKWQRDKRTFYSMRLVNESLNTIKLFKLKEGKNMPEVNTTILEADLDAAVNAMGDAAASLGAQTVNSFDKPAKAEDGKKTENDEAYNEIIRTVQSVNDQQVKLPMSVIQNNFQKGRLFGFITATDSSIKLQIQKKRKHEIEGNDESPFILTPNHSAEAEAFNKDPKTRKQIKMSECETWKNLIWKHSKPGSIKGLIFSIPQGTDIPLFIMGNMQDLRYDLGNDVERVYVLDTELAYQYITFNFGGHIKESEKVMGPKASTLKLDITYGQKKGDDAAKNNTYVRSKLVSSDRKVVVLEDNYIPLTVYRTIRGEEFNANAETLNLHVEAAMKNIAAKDLAGDLPEKLSAYETTATGKDGQPVKCDAWHSHWFDKGEKIEVIPYWETAKEGGQPLSKISIPVRIRTPKKGGGFMYKFDKIKYDAEGANFLEDTKYKRIIDATGKTVEEFKDLIKKGLPSGRTAGTKSAKQRISYEDYLRGMLINKENMLSSRSVQEVQDILNNVMG